MVVVKKILKPEMMHIYIFKNHWCWEELNMAGPFSKGDSGARKERKIPTTGSFFTQCGPSNMSGFTIIGSQSKYPSSFNRIYVTSPNSRRSLLGGWLRGLLWMHLKVAYAGHDFKVSTYDALTILKWMIETLQLVIQWSSNDPCFV